MWINYKLTCKALAFYTEYFGLAYPLPKLDLIALGDVEIGTINNALVKQKCLLMFHKWFVLF